MSPGCFETIGAKALAVMRGMRGYYSCFPRSFHEPISNGKCNILIPCGSLGQTTFGTKLSGKRKHTFYSREPKEDIRFRFDLLKVVPFFSNSSSYKSIFICDGGTEIIGWQGTVGKLCREWISCSYCTVLNKTCNVWVHWKIWWFH